MFIRIGAVVGSNEYNEPNVKGKREEWITLYFGYRRNDWLDRYERMGRIY
jgi:hypothetical protein